MIEATCHCGAVRIETDEAPETVTECNCSICRRRGTLWAYYAPRDVRIHPAEGATTRYSWGDKSIEFHACKICDCTTHWASTDKAFDRMAINARLMAPELLKAVRLHKHDGASK
jgi:hypothetical protein